MKCFVISSVECMPHTGFINRAELLPSGAAHLKTLNMKLIFYTFSLNGMHYVAKMKNWLTILDMMFHKQQQLCYFNVNSLQNIPFLSFNNYSMYDNILDSNIFRQPKRKKIRFLNSAKSNLNSTSYFNNYWQIVVYKGMAITLVFNSDRKNVR